MKKKVITINYKESEKAQATREMVFKSFESAKKASEYYNVSLSKVQKACRSGLGNSIIDNISFLYEESHKGVEVDELFFKVKEENIKQLIFGK